MPHKFLFTTLLCLVAQMAFAESTSNAHSAVTGNSEPNWKTAEYLCPLSVKTEKSELRLRWYALYEPSDKDGEDWTMLYPDDPDKEVHIAFRFENPEKHSIYLSCMYDGFHEEITIHAKDAVACGAGGKPWRAVCWTADPYAGKKK